MSRAVNGDGVLRAQVMAAGKELADAIELLKSKVICYHELVHGDESRTRNNMSTASSAEQIALLAGGRDDLRRAIGSMDSCRSVMEEAHSHHKAQISVLPAGIFGGQARRLKGDGSVTAVPFDPMKLDFVDRASKDGFDLMTDDQKSKYIVRGHNPHPDFYSWDAKRQRSYLIGELDKDGGPL